jgi:F-type H+-transporting ATPase subunit b
VKRISLAGLVFCLCSLPLLAQQAAQPPADQAAAASQTSQQATAAQKASPPNLEKEVAQNERQLATESREAAGENDEEAFKHSPSVQAVARRLGIGVEAAYWILIVLNFAIVAALIAWFWRSKMPTAFRNRTESILKSMETARQASEDANRRLKDVEGRLARLDSEIGRMKATADAATQVEESRIREAAEEDKKKIIESAEQEIDAAARAARAQLKSFAAELAVGLAEKQIRIDPNTDQALVRGFGKQLSESARNGKENA